MNDDENAEPGDSSMAVLPSVAMPTPLTSRPAGAPGQRQSSLTLPEQRPEPATAAQADAPVNQPEAPSEASYDAASEATYTVVIEAEPRLVAHADADHVVVVRRQSLLMRLADRTRDVVVSALMLIIGAPIMAALWVLIRLDSSGPAVFTHERVGIGGRTFKFYKFRTMWIDARDRFPDLYAYAYSPIQIADMRFKQVVDPRLTRVGRWLRRTSLDELPNLFNVLRGDMTLVGPRPDIPQMLTYYRPDQLAKFSVKPGLTGLAQVSGRNILTFQQTITHDLGYVAGKTWLLDVKILARTLSVVCRQWGAL